MLPGAFAVVVNHYINGVSVRALSGGKQHDLWKAVESRLFRFVMFA